MSVDDALSVTPAEWDRFWSDHLRPALLPPEARYLIEMQRWDPAVLRDRGVPEADARLLAEYGLPAYAGEPTVRGPDQSWPTGRCHLLSRPELLSLPIYRTWGGLTDERFLTFAGPTWFSYCLRRDRPGRARWPVYYVSLGGPAQRLLVSRDLRSALEATLVWRRHGTAVTEAARRLDTDDPADLAELNGLIGRLADDLIAIRAIAPGSAPPHRRRGFWADQLDWLRIECLGAGYD